MTITEHRNDGGGRFSRMLGNWAMLGARVRVRIAVHPVLIDYAISHAVESWLDVWWRTAVTRREFLERALALLFGLLLSWAAVELCLRSPIPLPYALGAKLFSCYDEYDPHQAIYFMDPRLKVYVFKPGYETTCLWNRLRWHHRGDRWGFRNPESWDRTDIVLLGDSFTYGHGVEENATIAHFLREETGHRVANLGVTAGSPVEYVAYLRNFALRLHPKVVVTLVFANDIEDIPMKRTIEQQEAFVARQDAPELGVYDPESLVHAGPDMHAMSFGRLKRWTLAYQTLRFYEPVLAAWAHHPLLELAQAVQPRPNEEAPPDVQHATKPKKLETSVLEDAASWQIAGTPAAMAYARRAFSIMAASCRDAGAELVIGFLPELDSVDQTRDDVMEKLCADVARSEGLRFLDLRPALSGPDGRAFAGDRLPIDGHLTAQGSRRAAAAIARFVATPSLAQ